MFRWKREKGGGVISYCLYLLDNRTSIFIMREHGFSGNWVGRVGTTALVEDKLLGQVKASLEVLLECTFFFQLAERHWEKALEESSKAWFKGKGRQRASNEFGYALNRFLDIEEELESVLGKGSKVEVSRYPGFGAREACANTRDRIQARLDQTFAKGEVV